MKERAFAAATKDARRKQAGASFEAYHRLHQAKQGYYPGINAATMALCAGDTVTARKIAALLTATVPQDSEEYWPLATLAEALLIVDRGGEAKDVLLKARTARGADDGAKRPPFSSSAVSPPCSTAISTCSSMRSIRAMSR
ncbi:hypothetical protein [Methyloceanibacter superfactus]|uniref:hypothetical protein n=1 Tax=Methyloceanibacter superfactus TaxID=1774969 RepID=UPI001FCE0DE5|nr:hypothetical protein [Methyloceanibacter superfactus]